MKKAFSIYWRGLTGFMVYYNKENNEVVSVKADANIIEEMVCAGALKRKYKNDKPVYYINTGGF